MPYELPRLPPPVAGERTGAGRRAERESGRRSLLTVLPSRRGAAATSGAESSAAKAEPTRGRRRTGRPAVTAPPTVQHVRHVRHVWSGLDGDVAACSTAVSGARGTALATAGSGEGKAVRCARSGSLGS